MAGSHDFYINQALTAFALKITNKDFIADKIFTPVPVEKDTVILKVFGDDHLIDESDDLRGPGAAARIDDFNLGTDVTLVLQEHSRVIKVPEEYEQNQTEPMRARLAATETLVERLMTRQERAMVTLLTSTGTYASSSFYTTPGTLWSVDTSNLIGDIQTGKQQIASSIGREPNIFWCGRAVWTQICQHPQVREVAKYHGVGEPAQQMVAALFGVDEVIIGRAIYNTAKRKATSVITSAWGKHAGLIYRNPTMSLYDMTFGIRVQKAGLTRVIDESWDDETVSTKVRIRDKYQLKVVGNKAGYWFDTPVA